MSVCMHACACVHEYHSVNVCRITALVREFGTGNRWYRPAYCCGGASVYYSHTVGMLFFNYHKMVSRLLATCV